MRNHVAVVTAIMLLLVMTLQGCGHKGPLFLPPPHPAPAPAASR